MSAKKSVAKQLSTGVLHFHMSYKSHWQLTHFYSFVFYFQGYLYNKPPWNAVVFTFTAECRLCCAFWDKNEWKFDHSLLRKSFSQFSISQLWCKHKVWVSSTWVHLWNSVCDENCLDYKTIAAWDPMNNEVSLLFWFGSLVASESIHRTVEIQISSSQGNKNQRLLIMHGNRYIWFWKHICTKSGNYHNKLNILTQLLFIIVFMVTLKFMWWKWKFISWFTWVYSRVRQAFLFSITISTHDSIFLCIVIFIFGSILVKSH